MMHSVAIVNTNFDVRWSIGKSMIALHRKLLESGYDSVACAVDVRDAASFPGTVIRIGNGIDRFVHQTLSRITGCDGGYSLGATRRLVRLLRARKTEAVFLLLSHGFYLNETVFFDYIKKDGVRLVYPMMDEFPFLGKCHFSRGCTGFLDGCRDCRHASDHPKCVFASGARKSYARKEACYRGLERAAFVGPRITVENAAKSPLMKGKRLEIVNEAIDVSIYRPRDTSRLRRELDIRDDQIVCVCTAIYDGFWHERKGVPYFLEAARRFEGDDRFVFVQVAYAADYPPGLPSNVRTRGYVWDRDEMAEYLSLGDVAVFPTMADTMSHACLEAMACGTPILCFDIYGNSYMAPSGIGTFVAPGSVEALAEAIGRTEKKTEDTIARCRRHAEENYDVNVFCQKLISIAESLEE